MRKPFYWKERGAWFYDLDSRGAKHRRRVCLSTDRDDAFRIWEETYRPEQERRREERRAKRRLRLSPTPKRSEAIEAKSSPVDRPRVTTMTTAMVAKRQPEPKPEMPKPKSPEPPPLRSGELSRRIGVERILILIELLAPLRRGARVHELTQDVAEILGRQYSDRTIERDLTLLHELGIAERVRDEVSLRWRFVDQSIRSAVLSKTAELRAMQMVG